jgi:NNP family nitrate/nitrite transporter-like MFS transporter
MNTSPLESLRLFSFSGVQMRTFHLTWMTFFLCFFGWFGLAPLMPTIRADLGLTKAQVGNTIIAAVSMTIFARLLMGWLCDVWGPRKSYTLLLVVGAVPVMGVGLAHDYTSFLLFRLGIGVIGASFVVTQYHTSVMFAPAIKGTANAVAGGWGNLGGGVTNMVMPLIFAGIVGAGYTPHAAWRIAMVVPGAAMLLMAFLYYRFTKDTPAGNLEDLPAKKAVKKSGGFRTISADIRVWALFLAYAASFGMEITFDGVAALHFVDTFGLSQASAGFWAGIFGFMNLFARALGGVAADKVSVRYGMRGKGVLLAVLLLLEGLGLLLFAQAGNLTAAIVSMLTFALFLKMANGGNYAIVPFVNPSSVGWISGIVGAGGNLGGVLMGFLFKSESLTYADAFRYIGFAIAGIALFCFFVNFSGKTESVEETVLA